MIETFDLVGLRSHFPALSEKMRGRDLVYFDNGATSLKPKEVVDALTAYYLEYSANIHRGVYEMSARATTEYDVAREAVRRMLGVTEGAGEVIFTRGTTESINLVAYAWGLNRLGPGDEILLTPMEHHSNLVPWQQIAKRTGATLRYIPLTGGGSITAEAIHSSITGRTRLVAVTAMSNVTGYVPPLDLIIAEAHRRGALVLLDGAQYVSHHPVDVDALDCDFLAFSGHKMCGPTGIGVLYAKQHLLEEMDPFMYGGDMIQRVQLEDSTWAHVPEKFEAGTPNIAGAIGIGAAARFLTDVGMAAIAAHERDVYRYARERMASLDYITEYGDAPEEERGGIYSFSMRDVHPNDVGALLDQQGIAVRTGFHCAQPLMDHFGVGGTVRASFYLYNTPEEIDRFVEAVMRVHAMLA
ncbi:MAG: SufS family cysteine desulfurase [Spirochaetales bacterium]|nr:SufS family cysteine desulfurase [Spirochaetales bacterium]